MTRDDALPPVQDIYGFVYETELTRRIDAVHAPDHFTWIDTAWAVMLMRQGIVPAEHAPRIAAALRDFWAAPDKRYFDFGGIERFVIDREGLDVGGSLTIGRTIPPLRQIFAVRHRLLKLMGMLHDLQEAMLDLAEEHLETVMPGYTHVRQAQPETFGHYLLSAYDPVDRVMKWVEDGAAAMSLNELGCGALAGVSLPIDRDLTSEYLGLDGLIENTNDAVAYTDGFVHLTAALANLVSIFSRLTLDFQFWSGEEYGFLHIPWLAKRHRPASEGGQGGGHSHFMPNKLDNAPIIERTRIAAAELAGLATESLVMASRAPHADMHEMLHMADAPLRAIHAVHRYLHVWIYTLPRMTVHRERMLAVTKQGYSCASELAMRLVTDHGLNYRMAHEVVHEMVAAARTAGIPATELPLHLLDDAAQRSIGRPTGMTQEALRNAMDPEHFVRVTTSRGGTSPAECRRMLDERRPRLAEARGRLVNRVETLERARARLLADLDQLT